MATDPRTMLLLTLAIAFVASGFLALEWRALRETALAYWSAGFAAITIGCSLSPLREGHSFLIGIWVANAMVPIAHLLYLYGAAHFVGRRLTPLWWSLLVPLVVVLVTGYADRTAVLGVLNTAFVALLALKTAHLLLGANGADIPSMRLGFVFLLHGTWYAIKTVLIFVPGAYVDVSVYKGFAIEVSFFEGILVAVLLALLMPAVVRRRHERSVEALAELDPLTEVLNRRGFERRAAGTLQNAGAQRWSGALMLLDLDGFKSINDSVGHGYGDQILVALTRAVEAVLPRGALLARLGGDEFVVLVSGVDTERVTDLSDMIRAGFARAGAALQHSSPAVTVSIGAVTFVGAADLACLLDAADASLYRAKRSGRDRLCIQQLGTYAVGSLSRGESSLPGAWRSELQAH